MLVAELTSRARRVTFGRLPRCDILERVRAVAKTWRFRFWKATAREDPMPPRLQPVMRTDFMADDGDGRTITGRKESDDNLLVSSR